MAILLAYSATLACLLHYQSLWVDEILQLIGTRSGTLSNTQEVVRTGVGSVPLGWLPQLFAIHIFGYSPAIARLPSALASVGCLLAVVAIAKELPIRYPIFPAILLALMPLQFRYALEGRPYAQGVLLGALATLVFIRLFKRRSLLLCLVYALVLALGIYSQPFTCFIAFSHFVWALTIAHRDKRLVYCSGFAIVFMGLVFLPWYRYAAPFWVGTITSGHVHFQLSAKTPLMLIREITGAGYIGGIGLILLAVLGFQRGTTTGALKWLLVLSAVIPVVCALAADEVFDYFLAIRQMIFVLPPLVLLAADALSALMEAMPWRVVGATCALVAIFVGYDLRWMLKPREDWQKAADALEALSTEHKACTQYAPPEALSLYEFFEPPLANTICESHQAYSPIVLAISPYATNTDRTRAQQLLRGRTMLANRAVGMSTIQVFR